MRNPIMIGQRIYLRPEELADAEIDTRSTAEETDDFIGGGGRFPASQIALEQEIREFTRSQPPDGIGLTVCLKETDEMIGIVGLIRIDYVNRTGETYSFFRPGPYRGRGYGTEAKHLLLEYAFDHLQLHIIHSGVFQANERSAAALIKQGYKPAGRMKWHYSRRGVYLDLLLFGVKREEWLAAREAL